MPNLQILGLHLEDLYIQNLVTEYLDEETGKNKNWGAAAEQYLSDRKSEFDKFDPTGKVPVFLTAERLYRFLLNNSEKKWKASELYGLETDIPIPADSNKLGRPLIPLYRHYRYNLMEWPDFSEDLRKYLNQRWNN